MDYKKVSHNGDNSCVKGDEYCTWIHHEVTNNTRPGSKDFGKGVNKIRKNITKTSKNKRNDEYDVMVQCENCEKVFNLNQNNF